MRFPTEKGSQSYVILEMRGFDCRQGLTACELEDFSSRTLTQGRPAQELELGSPLMTENGLTFE